MYDLIKLLRQVKEITLRDALQRKERSKRGECFNIFSVLNRSTDEMAHSAFLAELLDSQGSHGLKNAFLKAFIECICPDAQLDTDSTSVYTEYFIDKKNQEETEGGRIDILLQDQNRNTIIIENKIYAGDQVHQLERYENFAKNSACNYHILYLTLDGHIASDNSSNKQRVVYTPISYRENILEWLNRCLELSACFPLVRETIRQYITNLEIILNMMNTENIDQLVEVCTAPENINTICTLFEHQFDIERKIRCDFLDELEDLAEKYNFEVDCDEGLANCRNDEWVSFYNKEISEHWAIYIGARTHSQRGGVFYGISQYEYEKPHVTKKILSQIIPEWEDIPQDSEFPFGADYLRGENDIWWDWRNPTTLRDMSNRKLLSFIEENVLQYILENHLLEKIEELTAKH